MSNTQESSWWFDIPVAEGTDLLMLGTYGTVYRARNKLSSTIVAIKKFKATKAGEGISLTACREIAVSSKDYTQLLRELKNENIINLREIFSHENALFLVYDYAEYDL